VSLQVAILEVLASYSGGRASLAEMEADLAILAGAGPEWNARLKRLSARLLYLLGNRHPLNGRSTGWY
jgi:hypothetical protein